MKNKKKTRRYRRYIRKRLKKLTKEIDSTIKNLRIEVTGL